MEYRFCLTRSSGKSSYTRVDSSCGPGLTERKLGAKFGSETLYFQTRGSAVRIQETTSTAERVPGVMQPSLGINYIIAIQGIYPSRN
ncbi:MAG: hypothetical protein R3B93_13890 [Bacteroidia bacterium]